MPKINPDLYISLSAAFLLVLLYRLVRRRLKSFMSEQNIPETVVQIDQKLPILFWSTLLFFIFNNVLYNLEHEHLTPNLKSLLLSGLSLIWGVIFTASIYPILVLQGRLLRSMIAGTILFVLFYDNLAAWQLIPGIWSVTLVFHEFGTIAKLLIYNFLTLYAVIAYLSVGHPMLEYLTRKSETDLDDDLLEMIKTPVVATIIIGAIGYSNSILQLSSFAHDTIHSTIVSAAIIVWTRTGLTGVSMTLNELLRKKQESAQLKGLDPHHIGGFINARTLPALNLTCRVIIVVLATNYVLHAWDVDPTAWLASAGIIGVAVAYASQDTLASLLAGVAILTDSPYKMNDFLILDDGQRGRVDSIGFRSTRLMTPDDVQVIIPNAIMANTKIINISGGGSDYARIDCMAGVAYGSDIELVRQLLFKVSKQMTYIISDTPEKTPQVHFVSMGASSLDFMLRVWLRDPAMYAQAQDEANTLIYTVFTEHNIEIPYTKQDLYLYPGAPIEVSNVVPTTAAK
ncbi:MAG: mechanosensitive ion channel family protein [Myxococcota bacterium]